jgi:hypothetical protein
MTDGLISIKSKPPRQSVETLRQNRIKIKRHQQLAGFHLIKKKRMESDIGSLNVLSLDVLYIILDMLSLNDIMRLSNTCASFIKICCDSYVPRNHIFKFNTSSVTFDRVMDTVYKWSVSKIDLSDQSLSIDRICKIILFCPNLTEINLENTFADESVIRVILNRCQYIKIIKVNCNLHQHTVSDAVERIGTGFVYCPARVGYSDYPYLTFHKKYFVFSLIDEVIDDDNSNYRLKYERQKSNKQFFANSNVRHKKHLPKGRSRGTTMGRSLHKK